MFVLSPDRSSCYLCALLWPGVVFLVGSINIVLLVYVVIAAWFLIFLLKALLRDLLSLFLYWWVLHVEYSFILEVCTLVIVKPIDWKFRAVRVSCLFVYSCILHFIRIQSGILVFFQVWLLQSDNLFYWFKLRQDLMIAVSRFKINQVWWPEFILLVEQTVMHLVDIIESYSLMFYFCSLWSCCWLLLRLQVGDWRSFIHENFLQNLNRCHILFNHIRNCGISFDRHLNWRFGRLRFFCLFWPNRAFFLFTRNNSFKCFVF